jgi:hypothetical protein
MKPAGKAFFVSERRRPLHRSTVDIRPARDSGSPPESSPLLNPRRRLSLRTCRDTEVCPPGRLAVVSRG